MPAGAFLAASECLLTLPAELDIPTTEGDEGRDLYWDTTSSGLEGRSPTSTDVAVSATKP
ncbi:hypothetical protein RRF57_000376 [Xylaria bambusicola]|uniref:Uncharacterized protein n=1 Tax=Xylaria bambusicola TaxID=326684 RepID=A0AAN7U3H0_9PEZI